MYMEINNIDRNSITKIHPSTHHIILLRLLQQIFKQWYFQTAHFRILYKANSTDINYEINTYIQKTHIYVCLCVHMNIHTYIFTSSSMYIYPSIFNYGFCIFPQLQFLEIAHNYFTTFSKNNDDHFSTFVKETYAKLM